MTRLEIPLVELHSSGFLLLGAIKKKKKGKHSGEELHVNQILMSAQQVLGVLKGGESWRDA